MSAFDGLNFNSAYGTGQGRVTQAIANASRRTGVDFKYLMDQARIESSLNPNARASTSSATGLYQFVDQSWLKIVNDHGAAYGMDWAANAIQKSASGSYYVADPQLKQQILDLRNHPETASAMAAELASDNRNYLVQQTGREPQAVDLYLAHFLGAAGAAKFINSMASAPGTPAASLFPAAARANSSIFYDGNGNARTLAEIRDNFAQKLANGGATNGAAASGGTWAMPDGARMVAPADYMRIAQANLALRDQAITPDATNPTDPDASQYGVSEVGDGSEAGYADANLLANIQALTLGRTAAPPQTANAETARLAYLMLATLGR